MKRLLLATGAIAALAFIVLVVSCIQGDCGKANILDSITSTSEQVASETREMNARLAESSIGGALSVESISGHQLTLCDSRGEEQLRFINSRYVKGLLNMWQHAFVDNHRGVANPVVTVYIDFGGYRGVSLKPKACVVP